MREELTANVAILQRLAEIEKTLLIHDSALEDLYQKLLPLLQPAPEEPKPRIGFHNTLMATAWAEFKIVAAISALCSVKAQGRYFRCRLFLRPLRSQIVILTRIERLKLGPTTSVFRKPALRFSGSPYRNIRIQELRPGQA